MFWPLFLAFLAPFAPCRYLLAFFWTNASSPNGFFSAPRPSSIEDLTWATGGIVINFLVLFPSFCQPFFFIGLLLLVIHFLALPPLAGSLTQILFILNLFPSFSTLGPSLLPSSSERSSSEDVSSGPLEWRVRPPIGPVLCTACCLFPWDPSPP